MPLLPTSGPGEASPEIEEIYQSFLDTVGIVPPPFLMLSTSPGLQAGQAGIIRYYRENSGLSPLLVALVRLLTAVALGMETCVEFNARALTSLGLTTELVDRIKADPAQAPLGERDGWMLAFAVKAVQEPDADFGGHTLKLKELGWSDADILDALYIPCMMAGMDRMMRVLEIK